MPDDLIMPKVAWYKRKMILVVLVIVILTVLGGSAALFFTPSEDTAEQEPVIDTTPLYVGMPDPFLFSVEVGHRTRLVQIEVQLMVRGEKSQTDAQRHLPLMESSLLTVFSRQTADIYITAEGKQAVRQEALNELNAVLTEELGTPIIEKVLFTSIVMQ